MPPSYPLACFTTPFMSLPIAPTRATTQILVPSPSRVSITKHQKRRCKLLNFLQDLFCKQQKQTTPRPQNCPFSSCKKAITASFAYDRNRSNDSNNAATLTDLDRFALRNSHNRSAVICSNPCRSPDIRPSPRFSVSAGTSHTLVGEDVHVSGDGGTIALAMYTMDPYVEFQRSMQEMMDAHHVDRVQPLDWDFMQDLLLYYLKLNETKVHKYIIGAFLDLMKCIPSNPRGDPVIREMRKDK